MSLERDVLRRAALDDTASNVKRNFLIDSLLVLLVRNHFIIQMIWWTGLAHWHFEFPFSGIFISAFLSSKELF
jgi:hypothetical protein